MAGFESTADMIVTTTSTVGGHRIAKTIGAALGVVTFYDPVEELRPRQFDANGQWAADQTWEFGRNSQDFNDVRDNALSGREYAMRALRENAAALGANAVVDLRFDSCLLNTQHPQSGHVSYGIREIVAYGTAVVVEKAKSE